MIVMVFRAVRDSNPRYSHPYTALAGQLLRPLGHLSSPYQNRMNYIIFSNVCQAVLLFSIKKLEKQPQ